MRDVTCDSYLEGMTPSVERELPGALPQAALPKPAMSLLAMPARGANPYLEGLYGALAKSGVQVLDDQRFTARFLRGQRPDFVHYHWPENLYAHHLPFRQLDRLTWFLSKLALQRAAGSRIVWTFHNAVPHEAPWASLHAFARRRMVEMSDIILVNFEGARTELEARYGRRDRVWHVPHGSYRGLYPDTITRDEARRTLGIPYKARVFLLFGDLRTYKNIDLALAAFSRIPSEHARLVIAGTPRSSHDSARLAELCHRDRRVVLHASRISSDSVQVYFRAADLLLLPREAFSCGTAVLAFDFGLPVLAPRQHHLAELAYGSACFDLRDLSVSGVARAMQRLLTADLSQACIDAKRSTDGLGWNGIAEQLAQRLAGALPGSRQRA